MTDIKPVLEPGAARFAKDTDSPPFLYQLRPHRHPLSDTTQSPRAKKAQA